MSNLDLLLTRIKKDPEAFREIVVSYQESLFRFLSRYKLPNAIIEEIAQETFLRTYKNISRYDPQYGEDKAASFSTWLFTIAKRLAINELDRSSYKNTTPLIDELHVESMDAVSIENYVSLTDSLDKKQQKTLIQAAILRLPDHYRDALMLHIYSDLPLQAIADIEECPIGTIKSRICRAKDMLRSIINNPTEVKP